MTNIESDETATDHSAQVALAERLAAAWTSHRFGIGIEYALKRYVRRANLGPYWLELAKQIIKDVG